MITEDYVSFELAKLLKEKGFDELCGKKYNGYKSIVPAGKVIELWQNSEFDTDEECSAPTLQMTMKWLRLKHKAFISITYENDGVFTANLKVPSKEVDCMIDNKHNCWFTYEEAAEAAIKYCLENVI